MQVIIQLWYDITATVVQWLLRTTWKSEVASSNPLGVVNFFFVKFRFFVSNETRFYPQQSWCICIKIQSRGNFMIKAMSWYRQKAQCLYFTKTHVAKAEYLSTKDADVSKFMHFVPYFYQNNRFEIKNSKKGGWSSKRTILVLPPLKFFRPM